MTVDTSRVLAGGHRWMRCTSCGQEALALEEGGACRQRAAVAKMRKRDDGTMAVRWSCGGKLHAPDRLAKKNETACQRQGCRNVMVVTTALGECVCLRCLAALGDAIGRADDLVQPLP